MYFFFTSISHSPKPSLLKTPKKLTNFWGSLDTFFIFWTVWSQTNYIKPVEYSYNHTPEKTCMQIFLSICTIILLHVLQFSRGFAICESVYIPTQISCSKISTKFLLRYFNLNLCISVALKHTHNLVHVYIYNNNH